MDELQKLIDIQSSNEEYKYTVRYWDNLIKFVNSVVGTYLIPLCVNKFVKAFKFVYKIFESGSYKIKVKVVGQTLQRFRLMQQILVERKLIVIARKLISYQKKNAKILRINRD
jgi:imidazole glycerol phosphate synthase subunit HisF